MEKPALIRRLALAAFIIGISLPHNLTTLHLQEEINKGSTKYSPEELKKLNEKLKETNEFIEEMYKGGN